MNTFKKIAIIGLGLIGGSLAKTIRRKYPNLTIAAIDPNKEVLQQALSDQVIDLSDTTISPVLADCDCIILCAEVQNNIHMLESLKPFLTDDTILTDVSSVKTEIVSIINELGLSQHFIGGHPMAGSEKSGYENAKVTILENVYYLLTPDVHTKEMLVERFCEFLSSLQIIPLVLTPTQHDYATAAVSHFPHILAAGLVNMVQQLDSPDEVMKHIAAGGFKDITRIASSSPEMWKQICLTNQAPIREMLHQFRSYLDTIDQAIEASDSTAIYDYFSSAKDYRDSMMIPGKGSISKTYRFYCDLIDEAGGIATIATILASNHLSIKNIGIVHNREFEDGVLHIEMYDAESLKSAVALLQKYHYTIYER